MLLLLRSLSTGGAARSYLQPEEWCTPPSSWCVWSSAHPPSVPLDLPSHPHCSTTRITLWEFADMHIFYCGGLHPPLSRFWPLFSSLTINSWTSSALMLVALCPHPNVTGHSKVDGALLLCGSSGSSWLCFCRVHSAGSEKVGINRITSASFVFEIQRFDY